MTTPRHHVPPALLILLSFVLVASAAAAQAEPVPDPPEPATAREGAAVGDCASPLLYGGQADDPSRRHGRYAAGGFGKSPARTGASGAIDINLRPKSAEVWLDGERIGVADDFDGFPTYLWLPVGTYDIAFYLPGHRTLARQVSIYAGVVERWNDRLPPGEAVHPDDLVSKSTVHRDERLRRDRERLEEIERREAWRREAEGGKGSEIGRLLFAVSPPDASIYLDGHFLGTGEELFQLRAGLITQPGEHRIEVVHPDCHAWGETVAVPPGERIEIDVRLDPR